MPILNAENKAEWLEKAADLPQNKLELELAKSFPQRAAPTKIITKSETMGRLEVDLPNATLTKLKRAQEIFSQKRQKHIDAAGALEEILNEFIFRNDPLEKAKRAASVAEKPEVKSQTKSVRVVASTKNTATIREVRNKREEQIRELSRQQGFY